MKKEQAQELITRYQAGLATPEELALIERWVLLGHVRDMHLSDGELADELEVIRQRLPLRSPIRRIGRWLPYAAAILLIASLAGWWAIENRPPAVDTPIAAIQPGGNRATLTLADGRIIALSSAHEGIVVQNGITYLDGSQVVKPEDLEQATPALNAITTPKGGTYQISLPDGSRVWLNAASTLRYPSRFNSDKRIVFLEGEAFFEIKKQRIKEENQDRVAQMPAYAPFNVQTKGQTVEVLGTQFNISAYADEPETRTTLVEGRVNVIPNEQQGGPVSDLRSSGYLLTPGQQATVSGSKIEITTVDTEPHTAWKDGYFVLEATIPDILKEIGRWYDIEVVYQGIDRNSIGYYVKLQRDLPLADILEGLQLADPTLKFKITPAVSATGKKNGRRLTIFR